MELSELPGWMVVSKSSCTGSYTTVDGRNTKSPSIQYKQYNIIQLPRPQSSILMYPEVR